MISRKIFLIYVQWRKRLERKWLSVKFSLLRPQLGVMTQGGGSATSWILIDTKKARRTLEPTSNLQWRALVFAFFELMENAFYLFIHYWQNSLLQICSTISTIVVWSLMILDDSWRRQYKISSNKYLFLLLNHYYWWYVTTWKYLKYSTTKSQSWKVEQIRAESFTVNHTRQLKAEDYFDWGPF